jgi:hypothetical protein
LQHRKTGKDAEPADAGSIGFDRALSTACWGSLDLTWVAIWCAWRLDDHAKVT